MEVAIAQAEDYLLSVVRLLRDRGIRRESDRRWVEARLRVRLAVPSEGVRREALRSFLPEQRQTIRERWQAQTDSLVQAAEATSVPLLVEWAGRFRSDLVEFAREGTGP
jgi:hypothetical protein